MAVDFFDFLFSVFSALFFQPQTPNLEDDINEVILKDSGINLVVGSTPPEQIRKTMVKTE